MIIPVAEVAHNYKGCIIWGLHVLDDDSYLVKTTRGAAAISIKAYAMADKRSAFSIRVDGCVQRAKEGGLGHEKNLN